MVSVARHFDGGLPDRHVPAIVGRLVRDGVDAALAQPATFGAQLELPIVGAEGRTLDVHHRAIVGNRRQAARRTPGDAVVEIVDHGTGSVEAMDKAGIEIGGEELAILMPETDDAQALYVAEGIREAVAQLLIPHQQSIASPVVTVSIGGATLPLGGQESAAVLFEAADTALYRAKEAGRNRVNWRM